jgi:hypothetical protein
VVAAGGFGSRCSRAVGQFADRRPPKEGQFCLGVFFPSLTAMVGFWATCR